ncbi:3D domain-containing protein [Patescibacteria group bacterium]|nr:3D domain-containing protein [Patescibacteria group bacterium]MBU1987639.1 3D domain-containing protein [Patescibacteria group bacterium]
MSRKNKIISDKQNKILTAILMLALLFNFTLFPIPVLAKQKTGDDKMLFKIDDLLFRQNLLADSAGDSDEDIKMRVNLVSADVIKKAIKNNVNNNKFSLKFSVLDKKVIKKNIKNDLLKTQSADKRVITAYNSEKAQTDSSPCITANGFNVCKHGKEDTVATNFLKFGTKIRIPNLFGDKIFIVRDRMHKRHSNKVDVWMINKKDAIKFGVKIAKVEVVE